MVTNIPFWIASYWLGIICDGWFCISYVAVGLVGLFLPSLLPALLLLFVIAADLVSGVCETYFLTPGNCVANIVSMREFSSMRLIVMVGVSLIVLLVCYLAKIVSRAPVGKMKRPQAAVCLAAFSAICLSVDCLLIVRDSGHLPDPLHFGFTGRDVVRLGHYRERHLSRVPIARLIRSELEDIKMRRAGHASSRTASCVPSAATEGARDAGIGASTSNRPMPNFVLILVESWGLSKESAINTALLEPYFSPDLLKRYEISSGTVPFYGPTIAGEARELCGHNLGFGILDSSVQEFQRCLPKELTNRGYAVLLSTAWMDTYLIGRIGTARSAFRRNGLGRNFEDKVCRTALAHLSGLAMPPLHPGSASA